jgi:hypothetical protein
MSISLLFALASHPAWGSTVLGNPSSTIALVSGRPVVVESVEAVDCIEGSAVSTVQTTLSKGQSASITLPTGSTCSLLVDVRWDPSSSSVDTVAVDGFTTLDIASGHPSVVIELDEVQQSALLVED